MLALIFSTRAVIGSAGNHTQAGKDAGQDEEVLI